MEVEKPLSENTMQHDTQNADGITMATEALMLAACETTITELRQQYSQHEVNQIWRLAIDIMTAEEAE
jgi:NAD(P)H-hydrate repair Nnr-like enzyme with NAD(P)H-hydrate epimerase domain